MQTSDARALITGASRGIGKAVALRLAASGAHVAVSGRDVDALADVQAACRAAGGDAHVFAGDLTDDAYVTGLADAAADALGGLNVLVNNAGIGTFGPAQSADLDAWDRVMQVNVRSWFHLTRHALPHLLAQAESAVVNVCSIAGRMSFGGGAIYAASKHAIHGWSTSLFEDLRAEGVKVCALYPGFVNTELVAGMGKDPERMIQPDDIAQTVEFVLRFPATGCPTEIVIRPQQPV